MENKALGRGLGALLSSNPVAKQVVEEEIQKEHIISLDANQIFSGTYQPRVHFEEKELNELKDSIKENGILQPIIVRKKEQGYEIVAGERRFRAAKLLGLEKVPCIVKKISDIDAFKIALIENLQREDLDPIEEAKAYKRLVDEFEFTQEKIAAALGKDRATIANMLRLLQLPLNIQQYVSRGTISAGHARALLGIENKDQQIRLCERIIKEELTVRAIEKFTKNTKKGIIEQKIRPLENFNVLEKQEELQRMIGTKVKIVATKKQRGKIVISFYSYDDFERIVSYFKKIAL